MDGKKYFQHICEQNGIDCETYFKIGSQKGVNNAGYVYSCPHHTRKATQLFAINYLEELDVYIAWNLSKAPNKNSFRVLKAKLAPFIAGEILQIDKAVGYSGWNEETVYVFDRTAIELFLSRYVPDEVRRI